MIKKTVEKETDIQAAICDYLHLKKYFFWRQNTIPPTYFNSSINQNSFRRMPKYSMNGVPDIIIIIDGKFIGLEVKRKGGIQSESQHTFEIGCEIAGGQYELVRSVEDVKALGL